MLSETGTRWHSGPRIAGPQAGESGATGELVPGGARVELRVPLLPPPGGRSPLSGPSRGARCCRLRDIGRPVERGRDGGPAGQRRRRRRPARSARAPGGSTWRPPSKAACGACRRTKPAGARRIRCRSLPTTRTAPGRRPSRARQAAPAGVGGAGAGQSRTGRRNLDVTCAKG